MTFDLEKARDAAKFDDHMAITMFPLAIAEIERLRAEISEQKGMIWKTQQVKKEQAAQIKSLEDALAEYQRLGKVMNGRLPCLTLHGDCDRCSPRAKEVCEAMHQITEDKIGPDDSKKISHLRPYEVVAADLAGMLAKSWQITEDRVTAIDQGLRFLEWSNAKTGHVETKKRIAILKTMLEEASDKHGFERSTTHD